MQHSLCAGAAALPALPSSADAFCVGTPLPLTQECAAGAAGETVQRVEMCTKCSAGGFNAER